MNYENIDPQSNDYQNYRIDGKIEECYLKKVSLNKTTSGETSKLKLYYSNFEAPKKHKVKG